MATLAEARTALATAVTGTGLQCLPYPPEAPMAPIAFVDSVTVGFSGEAGWGGTFCAPGVGSATIVLIAQRHDREASIVFLEGLLAPVLEALQNIGGVRLVSATSGALSIGGQDLPAVFITVQFPT